MCDFDSNILSASASPSTGDKSRADVPSRVQPVKGEIGFIGLGHMGTAMAANLAAAGRPVVAYVRRENQLAKLKDIGLRPTTDFGDLLDCELVISMLPDDDAVRHIVFGSKEDHPGGLAAGLMPGAIHLSMSTISTACAAAARGRSRTRRTQLRSCPGLRQSRCRQGPAIVHCGSRVTGGFGALSADFRLSWTEDFRGWRKPAGSKPGQIARQHDDRNRNRDDRGIRSP